MGEGAFLPRARVTQPRCWRQNERGIHSEMDVHMPEEEVCEEQLGDLRLGGVAPLMPFLVPELALALPRRKVWGSVAGRGYLARTGLGEHMLDYAMVLTDLRCDRMYGSWDLVYGWTCFSSFFLCWW